VQVAKTYYTNSQLYVMLRPDAMEIPYVYDNFQWTHCDVRFILVLGTNPRRIEAVVESNSPADISFGPFGV